MEAPFHFHIQNTDFMYPQSWQPNHAAPYQPAPEVAGYHHSFRGVAHNGARRPYEGGATSSPQPAESAKPSRSTQICLDHLKGICTSKRAKCKYAHPPLPFGASSFTAPQVVEEDTAPKLCEVYMLTGFCKFGAQCRDYHPPHTFNPVCAPAISSKMSTECRDAADAALGDYWEEEEEENEEEIAMYRNTAQLLVSLRDVLRSATMEDFDATPSIVDRIVTVLTPAGSRLTGECLQQFLPTLYSVAVGTHDKAEMVAKLCLYLFNLVEASMRNALRTQLVNQCGKLLYHVEDMLSVFDGAQEAKALEVKRLGNATFIGHLFSFGVITPQFLEQVVEYLLERSKRADAEGGFHARLMCQLLSTCGARLKETQPSFLQARLQRLARLARRHPAEVVEECAKTVAEWKSG